MLNQFVFILIAVSFSAEAAKFERRAQASDKQMQRLQTLAKKVVAEDGQFGDCGFTDVIKILKRRNRELRVNTIKQVLHTPTIGEVTAFQLRTTHQNLIKAVDGIGGEQQDQEDENARKALVKELEQTLKGEVLLYSGFLGGAHSTELHYLAVWDKKTDEIVAFGNGYCE